MALTVHRNWIGRDLWVTWFERCDDCGTLGPANGGEPGDGLRAPPKGWTQAFRGSLLVSLCPACRPDFQGQMPLPL